MLSESYTGPSHILVTDSSKEDQFAGAGMQRSVLQRPALERKSCRHCQGNMVVVQSCPTASRQPGAKALRCANSKRNGFFFFFFFPPAQHCCRVGEWNQYSSKKEKEPHQKENRLPSHFSRAFQRDSLSQLCWGPSLLYQWHCCCSQRVSHPP